MPSNRDEMTLADYVAIALGPVLIMALVGSLVFLLLEVLYQGQYQARLQWILFFFVFGAVLVSRISMTQGIAERAGLYGLILGGLTWFALAQFVEYPPGAPLSDLGWLINLFLIGIIWWSAHRLTWDCTLIDDSVDASGVGLLDAGGLDTSPAEEPADADGKRKKRRKDREATGLAGWWQRYQRYRAEVNKRPHTPGVWVMYFSLAALPIFGVGQSLIPPDALDRRQYVFWLMVVYVASGLGLLLATSFLGLRRYLRQKKLQMPVSATSVWLLIGSTLVAVLLFVCALLPRPNAEYRMLPEWLAGSPERDASNWAMTGGKPGKDKGREIADKAEQGKEGGSGGKGKGQGKDGKDKGQSGQGKGQEKGSSGQGKDKGQSGGDKQGNKGQGDKSQGDKSNGGKGEKSGEKGGRDGGKGKSGQGKSGEKKEGDGQKRKDDNAQQQQQQQTEKSPQSAPWKLEVPPWLTTLLKWIIGIVLGLVVLFVLLRGLLKFLANFTNWARSLLAGLRSFWDGLWGLLPGGRKRREGDGGEEVGAEHALPFSFFRDPFQSGEAAGQSPEELVRYTFDALEAWARERHLARRDGETPLEFARRVGDEVPALEGDVLRLADFYVRVVYARMRLPEGTREPLRRFWQLLRAVVERPLSASVEG
jgi:hypothetical protein